MARRVGELEQEAAESRALSLHDTSCRTGEGDHHYPSFPTERSTVPTALVINEGVGADGGGNSERAGERALRSKNEILERQLVHMRDAAEETQLELAAAKKVSVACVLCLSLSVFVCLCVCLILFLVRRKRNPRLVVAVAVPTCRVCLACRVCVC